MNKDKETTNKNVKTYKDGFIHLLLAHGYLMFFVAVVFGVIADMSLDYNLLSSYPYPEIGLFLIGFGTLLVFWAQSSSLKAGKVSIEESTTHAFAYGPYKYFRNPTYLGLFTMTLGLGLLLRSIFAILFVLIVNLFTKLILVKREELLLENKYGEIYKEYKKKVRDLLWFIF